MLHIHRMAADATFPVKKLVSLTEEQARQISTFRYDQRLPSDNEAIRRLIEVGLEATAKPQPAKPPHKQPRPAKRTAN